MPKVLGMDEMGNFEVLKWMRETRERHAREDREAEAEGLVLKPRPAALNRAFEKHERHLTRDVYPYEKNPSVHNEKYDVDVVVKKLYDLHIERVCRPILRKYEGKVRAGELSKKQAEDKMDEELDPKCFTEMELMQMHNLAPTGIETIQLCIEQWEERFTEEEMQVILECIAEILRPDELAAKKAKQGSSAAEEVKKVETEVEAGGEKDTGLGETGKMKDALREMSPFSARAERTFGPVAELAHRPGAAADQWPAGWAVAAEASGPNTIGVEEKEEEE